MSNRIFSRINVKLTIQFLANGINCPVSVRNWISIGWKFFDNSFLYSKLLKTILYAGVFSAVATVFQSLFWIKDSNMSLSITYVLELNYANINKNRLLSCRQIERIITTKIFSSSSAMSDFKTYPKSCIHYNNPTQHEYPEIPWNLV